VNGLLERTDRAADLPEGWDELATYCFQRRPFLRHAERYNHCRQRYWWLIRAGRMAAGAVVYTLRLDVLTYLHIPSPVRIHFVGIPCSVSAPGLVGRPEDVLELVKRLLCEERGLVVGLNLDFPLTLPGLATGRTLPTVLLARRFSSWAQYRGSLRSPYRRRLDRILARWEGVETRRGPCTRFDVEMHRQYLATYARSQAKLERLSLEFFRNLPFGFHLTTHRLDGRLLGWHVAATEGDRRYFVLGGVDDETNALRRNYFNLLAAVIREGIEDGAGVIDLGQTAETPKTRLGGRIVEKGLFGWHHRAAVRFLLQRFRSLLQYHGRVPTVHVFREGTS
jgi:hypothetical protein